MKRLTCLLAVTLWGTSVTAFAENGEPSEGTERTETTKTTEITSAAERSAAIYADGYDRFRFGGYGEILANFMDYGINRYSGTSSGNTRDHRNEISIPRFVLALDYKFNSKWILGAEIEFEAGGTGTAYEIENKENGEYETEVEKGGEVALEQFHITRLIHPAINVRAGHLIVPVGLTNEQHEPINFFGTSRPEGETTILPSTWHETGIELFGTFGKGYTRFNYQAMVVTGLNANGFDRDTWVASGKQGIFEKDNFTSPGYVARLNYLGVPGLKVGGSFYFCNNTAANSDKHTEYNSIGKVPLRIYTADVQYKNKYVTARGNIVYGNLGNSKLLSDVNRRLSGLSPYSRLTPIAKHAVSYGGEVGFNLRAICKDNPKVPVIYPFVRYEYYNPQEEGESGQVMDLRDKVGMWTAGANWYALPNLVVKADYTTRRIGNGNYNSENEFSLAIAYIGWFWSK